MIEPAGSILASIPILVAFSLCILLAGVVVLLGVIRWIRRRRVERQRDEAWANMQTVPHEPALHLENAHTYDNWKPDPSALGFLTVQSSDDRTKIGQRIELKKEITTLGRSRDNDISFPKDSPVSRHHARIEMGNEGNYLIEAAGKDDIGQTIRPKFGTYVNQTRVESAPIALKPGDVIRLGKRVYLRFDPLKGVAPSDDQTYVAFSSQKEDPDKTQAQPDPGQRTVLSTRDTEQ